MDGFVDDIITKRIQFAFERNFYTLITKQTRLEYKSFLMFKFSFEPNQSGLEFVTMDNEKGYARMITSNGEEYYNGSLFNSLIQWFNELEIIAWHCQ